MKLYDEEGRPIQIRFNKETLDVFVHSNKYLLHVRFRASFEELSKSFGSLRFLIDESIRKLEKMELDYERSDDYEKQWSVRGEY